VTADDTRVKEGALVTVPGAGVLHLLTAPWTTGTELLVDGGLLARE